jgi:hypothetical protein
VQCGDAATEADPHHLEFDGRRLGAIPNSRGIITDCDGVVMSFKPEVPDSVPPHDAARLETDDAGAENNQEKEYRM